MYVILLSVIIADVIALSVILMGVTLLRVIVLIKPWHFILLSLLCHSAVYHSAERHFAE
jgi:hypothetical protein